MKAMKAVIYPIATIFLTFPVSCHPPGGHTAQRGPEYAARRSATAVDRMLVDSGFRGSFLVALGEQRILAKGYGHADRAGTVPSTPATAYWSASVAKNFTAAAVMHLVDRDVLGLDDRVGEHLPELPPDWDSMTVRHLLTHTSGIRQNYASDGVAERGAALEAICAMPLGFPPGKDWQYSNDAYSVLAIFIEVVSGRTYEDYLRDALFAPAGLANSGFRAEPPDDLAEFEDPSYDRIAASWGFRGGHGIATTAEDLHRWWLALRSDRVLSSQSKRTMLSPQVRVNDTVTAGFGWFQQQTPAGASGLWTRGTDQSGENAILYVLPEYDFIVIGLSHHDGDKDPVTRRVADRAITLFEEALAE